MTDPTKRKIKMPTWHVPYLEKHNIYKLFYEVARQLVIHQPDDHVFFIKYLLTNAVKSVHLPHVILLGSPRVNLLEIAKQISAQIKLVVITRDMVLSVLKSKINEDLKPSELVLGIQSLIAMNSAEILSHGWLLVDCIKTKEEAQKLLDVGILPTHVLYLISPYCPKLTELLYCNVSINWPIFRRNMVGVLEIFQKKLIEVHLNQEDLDTLVKTCIGLINIEKIEKGPKVARVLLLGPRGSGRKTQAKLLEEKLAVIHIDFEDLLCQAWQSQSELGKKLRAAGDKSCFDSALLCQVLNQRLLDAECLQKGWVLTNYPFNVMDFKYLDCLETPPNRVIFLECDLNVCHERVVNRKVNVDTGSMNNLDADAEELTKKRLKFHPKDRNDLLNAELEYYCTQYGAMRRYAGKTAVTINADQPERWIFENIVAVIMRDVPLSSPRDPFQFESFGAKMLDPKEGMAYKRFQPENCDDCCCK